jgi:hypothetical protein
MKRIIASLLGLATLLATSMGMSEEGDGSLGDAANKAWSGVKSGSKEAWDGVSEGGKEAWQATKKESGKVWKATKEGAKEVVDSVSETLSGDGDDEKKVQQQ